MDEKEDKVEEQRDVSRKVGQWCAWLFSSDALYERHDDIAVHENLQQVVPIDKERVLPGAQALVRGQTPNGEGDLARHEQHRHNHGELGHPLVILDQNLELLVVVKIGGIFLFNLLRHLGDIVFSSSTPLILLICLLPLRKDVRMATSNFIISAEVWQFYFMEVVGLFNDYASAAIIAVPVTVVIVIVVTGGFWDDFT